MAADKQHGTYDFAGRIHQAERDEIIFRHVLGGDTAGLDFSGGLPVFSQTKPVFN